MLEVIAKILFNYITFVSSAYNEVIYSESRVGFHNVPKHWLAADFDHGFRSKMCFLGEPSAQTTGQYDCLHVHSLSG